jgi:hypothetical protein
MIPGEVGTTSNVTVAIRHCNVFQALQLEDLAVHISSNDLRDKATRVAYSRFHFQTHRRLRRHGPSLPQDPTAAGLVPIYLEKLARSIYYEKAQTRAS